MISTEYLSFGRFSCSGVSLVLLKFACDINCCYHRHLLFLVIVNLCLLFVIARDPAFSAPSRYCAISSPNARDIPSRVLS